MTHRQAPSPKLGRRLRKLHRAAKKKCPPKRAFQYRVEAKDQSFFSASAVALASPASCFISAETLSAALATAPAALALPSS